MSVGVKKTPSLTSNKLLRTGDWRLLSVKTQERALDIYNKKDITPCSPRGSRWEPVGMPEAY